MATRLTESAVKLDDLVAEVSSPRFSYTVQTYINNSGATASYPIGQVLVASSSNVTVATSTSATGVLCDPITDLANGATVKVKCLMGRVTADPAFGDCAVYADALSHGGGTAANQITALEALGIHVIPSNSTVNTLAGQQ